MSTVQHSILIVDDEESIRSSLTRLFAKLDIPILSASGSDEALEMMSAQKEPVTLIISDQRMPEINGAEFLEKSRDVCPDAIRFLLTGFSDIDAVIDAVNKGRIHRYLKKPWDNDELISQVKESLKQYELITENKRLLAENAKQTRQLFRFGVIMKQKVQEHSQAIAKLKTSLRSLDHELKENYLNTVKAFLTITEGRMPATEGHGSRVSLLCRELGEKLNLSDRDMTDLELASLGHDIGKMNLSDGIWTNAVDQLSEADLEIYKTHPEEGEKIMAFSSRLEAVGKIIRHHHEHFDGSGWPDGLTGDDIPIGSRIIAIVDAYDRMKKMNAPIELEESTEGKPTIQDYFNEKKDQVFDPDITASFLEIASNET